MGYPPGYPQRRRKRTGLIVTLVLIALLVLGGLGTGVFLYLDAHADGGVPPTGAQLDERCDAVSTGTLSTARTTNPDPTLSTPAKPPGSTPEYPVYVACAWTQTEGVDGEGSRGLEVQFRDLDPAAPSDAFKPDCKQGVQISPPKLGDTACLARLSSPEDTILEIQLQVQKGDHTVLVNYRGWDVGLFDSTAPDPAEFIGVVNTAGTEAVGSLEG